MGIVARHASVSGTVEPNTNLANFYSQFKLCKNVRGDSEEETGQYRRWRRSRDSQGLFSRANISNDTQIYEGEEEAHKLSCSFLDGANDAIVEVRLDKLEVPS